MGSESLHVRRFFRTSAEVGGSIRLTGCGQRTIWFGHHPELGADGRNQEMADDLHTLPSARSLAT